MQAGQYQHVGQMDARPFGYADRTARPVRVARATAEVALEEGTGVARAFDGPNPGHARRGLQVGQSKRQRMRDGVAGDLKPPAFGIDARRGRVVAHIEGTDRREITVQAAQPGFDVGSLAPDDRPISRIGCVFDEIRRIKQRSAMWEIHKISTPSPFCR